MKVKNLQGKEVKITRNDPCLCGSGRKFKRCCLPDMERQRLERKCRMDKEEGLQNEYRNEAKQEALAAKSTEVLIAEETAKVGEAVMLQRDMFVTMRQLQVQKQLMKRDLEHNSAAVEIYNKYLEELADLSLSSAREGVAAMVSQQLDALNKHVEQSKFNRASVIALAAVTLSVNSQAAKRAEVPTTSEPFLADDTDDDLDKIDEKEAEAEGEELPGDKEEVAGSVVEP